MKLNTPTQFTCIFIFCATLFSCESDYLGYTVHQPITLDFSATPTSETAAENPFLDYRLQVEFTNGDKTLSIPGFYAADGNAAETGANTGSIWRVIFTPNEPGKWTYKAFFKKGKGIAVSDDPYVGLAVEGQDGKTGSFRVAPASNNATGFEKSGRLTYNGTRYLHTEDGNVILKLGANSPENYLACADIDGTYSYDPNKQFIKTWSAHEQDWKHGDPTWQGDKGKGIIGALNYLASKNMNAVYALTLNIEGDARDIWPFISHERKDFQRYDVSKLAQWDIIFSHAEKLGIIMHLITQEKENELILDDGNTQDTRKLYYRELIARFAHHKNIIWNMGEENGPAPSFWPQGQNDQQRFAMIRYVKEHDPYKNPVLIHTMSERDHRNPIIEPLLGFDKLDGLSMQVSNVYNIHEDIKYWIDLSAEKKRPWIVSMDEIGPWHTGTNTDQDDPKHDTLRAEVLWSTLMAGGAGVEWYFGWLKPHNDLNAEDWRTRENVWEQTSYAADFFKTLPLSDMKSTDHLLSAPDNYCLSKAGEVYAIYLKNGSPIHLDLGEYTGTYEIKWYNPRSGEWVKGSIASIQGGGVADLGNPESDRSSDWAIRVSRTSQ